MGVVMGSDSDLPVVRDALDTLAEFGVAHEARILSAHRTPEALARWVQEAAGRGVRVFIAAAGGAAHLPGVVAALTTLPVVGLPVLGRSLEGLDAILSIVQMPPGIPVATVGVNAARNAGLLALAILGAADPELRAKLDAFRAKMAEQVQARDARLQELGAAGYLESRAGQGAGGR